MRVLWLPSARQQREAAIDYIAEEDSRAALRVLEQILEHTALLGDHPHAGRWAAYERVRELVVPRTPYVVVYTVDDDAVRILAIYHHGQKRP